jgi:hypothetical protein
VQRQVFCSHNQSNAIANGIDPDDRSNDRPHTVSHRGNGASTNAPLHDLPTPVRSLPNGQVQINCCDSIHQHNQRK